MELTRRKCFFGLAALPAAVHAVSVAAQARPAEPPSPPPGGAVPQRTALPDRTDFPDVPRGYLDSGSMHPDSLGGRRAVEAYHSSRKLPGSPGSSVNSDRILANYARLINAAPAEVAFAQSTTAAEHMIVDALGLFEGKGHVVTDTLHFFGSFPLYEGLARRGVEVTWLRPRDGRIVLEDMERAIRPDTKLVALSLVSTFNGFEHDLSKVCELAHAKGAMVYADIIHAAGAVPVDLRASGVDFAGGASYKWLMGDFGLGFVYARRESQARLQRKRYGYYGVSTFQSHAYPFDPPGKHIADFTMQENATGQFAMGTYAHSPAAQLDYSLQYLLTQGVDRINAHARTLTERLKRELPRLGYKVVTPPESRAPIVTCVLENARSLSPRFEQAGLHLTVSRNRFRITPSVFNDMDDLDLLLRTLRG